MTCPDTNALSPCKDTPLTPRVAIITDKVLLSLVCSPMDIQDPGYKASLDVIVSEMLQVVNENSDTCVGLAANQVGIFKRVVLIRGDKDAAIFLVNPTVIKCWGGFISCEETCLSRPAFPGTRVRRAKVIKVRYWDPIVDKFIVRTFKDIFSIIIQHEIDHLNGKFIGKV